ncbi:solute carrier family 25 member 44-like [Babylonia areolata]|uniref:solute carrier family 25 member 44-like n=1 Tax=Babylonia areolata TaxID=304850 RepID=UPI003FD145BD
MSFEMDEIHVVELRMMDKRKYYPLTLASGMSIRCMLYPFMLIKTRLQIQRGHTLYKGTFDAFLKISKHEGPSGLYRGFWVSCLQLFPSMTYITSYEWTRHHLTEQASITNSKVLSFISGGTASVIGQTLAVPLDIVTQHMMLMGRRTEGGRDQVQRKLATIQTLHVSEQARHSRFGAVAAVVESIYRHEGLLGFYKGYFVSLLCFAPNSALWWCFYDMYSDGLTVVSPDWVPRLLLRTIAGPLSGVSSAIITNPLDVIRARIQVEGRPFSETVSTLWRDEGCWMMTKGLSARLISSVAFSFFIVLGYESVKRLSLLDHYKDRVRW